MPAWAAASLPAPRSAPVSQTVRRPRWRVAGRIRGDSCILLGPAAAGPDVSSPWCNSICIRAALHPFSRAHHRSRCDMDLLHGLPGPILRHAILAGTHDLIPIPLMRDRPRSDCLARRPPIEAIGQVDYEAVRGDRRLQAVRTAGPITLDGALDEAPGVTRPSPPGSCRASRTKVNRRPSRPRFACCTTTPTSLSGCSPTTRRQATSSSAS